MVAALVIVSICIPVTALVMGFFVLKAVQLGLRWQVEVKEGKEPTMDPVKVEMPKPFEPKQPPVEMTSEVMDEWLNGPKDERR
ncbi:hypothetical protein ACFVVQ_12185 [Paenibacillus chitinolyticus]|uniref:hypothetical protein n=1 Tax=Paenibacillus chitinolyticus TaxID=79263 RepID=UPI0036DF9075